MPDLEDKIIKLLGYVTLIAGTVALLLGALKIYMTNRKGVKALREDVNQLRRELAQEVKDREDLEERTKESVSLLMRLVYGNRAG